MTKQRNECNKKDGAESFTSPQNIHFELGEGGFGEKEIANELFLLVTISHWQWKGGGAKP